jgi:glycosyltransferase involved in cell wall biosynthesis
MKPVVTIGMCVRNSENTVQSVINSIVNQDFPRKSMFLVVVDGGSVDRTLLLIKGELTKSDLPYKILHENVGLGYARQMVVDNANGEYIVWVDSDEILTKSYIKKQVEFMEKKPDVGITAGLVSTVQRNLVLNLELIPAIIEHLNFEKPKGFLWKTEKMPGTGGATFRVKALKQVGGFDEKITGVGEDQEIAYRIKNAGWSIRLNDARLYELHGGLSTFRDLWKRYRWYGYGCEKIYRQNRKIFSLPRMSPVAGILTGFFYSLIAYKLIRQKRVFLLPVHYGLKMTAWLIGFISSQKR